MSEQLKMPNGAVPVNAGLKLTAEQEQGLLDGIKAELAQYVDANGKDLLAAFSTQYTNFVVENPDTDKRFKWSMPVKVVVSPWRNEFGIVAGSKLTTSKKLASEGSVVQLPLI